MGKYSKNEVIKETKKYFDGDELASNVWTNKYALRDPDGNFCELTPLDMHKRMAKEFNRIENKYDSLSLDESKKEKLSEYGKKRNNLNEEKILEYFDKFKYIIPQGSVMASLGDPYSMASLSNCIVIPELYDSYGGIMYADQQLTHLFKRRCGVGLDISNLRPDGMNVKNSAKTTTGAVSFMERFSNTTREVAQNSRRGALILTIDINHPDIYEFVKIKSDLKKVTGANISIKVHDEFMKAVENNENYTLKFPVNSNNPKFTKEIVARDLWNLIIKNARNNAEPGLLMWTTQHYYSTSSLYPQYKNISTNPCSEIAMGPDSCRLIALNMFSCVVNPYTKDAYFDFDKWYEITYEAQRLMDDSVDLELESVERILKKIENDPEPDYIKDIERRTWELLYESGKKGRRTGLGFTGLGDVLASLNIKYDSEDSLSMVEKIMKNKCKAEFDSSIDMSIERGKFDGFDPEIEKKSKFIQMLRKDLPEVYKRNIEFGRRNVSISTIAPTGSLSILTQTTSGIEPVYKLKYKRRKKISSDSDERVDFVDDMGDKWQEFDVIHNGLKKWMDINNIDDISKSPYFGCGAEELEWKFRINIQSVCQKYTTHSISSTINLKSDVDEKIVSDIYLEAWKKNLKGITIYRDGSRSGVLVSADNDKETTKKVNDFIKNMNAPKRPKELECDVLKFTNKGEKWIGFIGLYEGEPYEVFTGIQNSFPVPNYVEKGIIRKIKENNQKRYDFIYIDKDGYEQELKGLSRAFNKEYWDYAKMISAVLRHYMPVPNVINLLDSLHIDGDLIGTWKAGVKRMLKKYIKEDIKSKNKCPECGQETLTIQEGCVQCVNPECGWSKCG